MFAYFSQVAIGFLMIIIYEKFNILIFENFLNIFQLINNFFEDKPTYETENYSEERNSLQNDIVFITHIKQN